MNRLRWDGGYLRAPNFLSIARQIPHKSPLEGHRKQRAHFPHSERGESLSNDDSWQSDIPNQDMVQL